MLRQRGSGRDAGAAPAAVAAAPPATDRRRRLEERLSSAEAKRQQRLDAVVARAARCHAEVHARVSEMRQRELRLAQQLDAHLAAAEEARVARLAQTAARAGQAFARVREAAAERKLRAEIDASRRKLLLLQRLERAERARQEALNAAMAGRSPAAGAEGFLPRQATRRAALRRQSSSRKLQAAWRAFCEQRRTTAALAQGFVDTGVPYTVPLEEQPVGPQPRPVSVGPSSDPTPAGTPDPCGSPTSTVRRHDGRLASAPVSITQTPHSTPNRTPSHSLAGSPTSHARRYTTAAVVAAARASSDARGASPPLAMPPLRSIAMPAAPAAAAAPQEPGGFERLAASISSPATLKAAQALLARLESRVSVKGVAVGSCTSLLRRLFPRTPAGRALERYPPRIFLCAYMVLAHPEVVFNAQGEREAALVSAARSMLLAFEALLARLAEAPAGAAGMPASDATAAGEREEETEDEGAPLAAPLAAMLQLFDEAWVAYLEQFVAWKSADAAGLETELIRVAVELESSRLAKLAGCASPSSRLRSPEDIQAIVRAVDHDLELIMERVQRLTGAQGGARLAAALAATRTAAGPAPLLRHASSGAVDAELGSTPPGPGLSRSPSQSPIKKAPRSSGQYQGAPAGAPTPEARQELLPRSGSSMSITYSGPSEEAVDMDAALAQQGGNLALMWHLLYDPQWQLPTDELEVAWSDALGQTDALAEAPPAEGQDPEAAAAGLQQRVKRLAERAFWDSVQEKMVGGGGGSSGEARTSAVETVAALLADLGAQLAAVLPSSGGEAGEVAARLDRQRLSEELRPPAEGQPIDYAALLGLLDWSAQLLARYGAPARDAAAAAGQAAVRQQLTAAGGQPAATAAAAVRALRLLSVQLKTLRVDVANAHLRLLAGQLRSEGAAAYATGKLEGMLGSADSVDAEQLGCRLPHTRAWLAAASGQLPHVEQLEALSAGASNDSDAVPQQQALPHLRAGLRSFVASAAAAEGGAAGPRHPPLHTPVEARSWRGLVRLGLVQLVSGEGAVGRLPLPETLRLDAARLHAAQGEFQRLLVTATCLLLVRQSAVAAGQPFGAAELAAAKLRLAAMLADPSVRLPDIAAECGRLAGGESSAARDRAMHDSLQRMLSRSAGALKALTSGLTAALLALLLHSPASAEAQAQASLALRKCGAADLGTEVAGLVAQLVAVAAVGEAVCAPWYDALAADLL